MRSAALGLGLGIAAAIGLAVPASAAAQLTPRAGTYSGTETGPGDGSTITFTVTANHKVMRKLDANAPAKASCTAHYKGFTAPAKAIKIGKKGGFAASSTAYPGPKVRVTITGRFTSATTVTGRLTVRFKTVKGCNATTPFTAQRTP